MSQNWLKDASRSDSLLVASICERQTPGLHHKEIPIDAVVDIIFCIVGAGSITISYQ